MKHFSYIVIFVAGVLCSVGVLHIFQRTAVTKPRPFISLPSDLQVREDFQVLQYHHSNAAVAKAANEDAERRDTLSSSELEALNSLRMATEMRLEGKEDKALRLFQHAIALAPKHPEVLNKYGEYLEHSRQDVVLADQMYFQVRDNNIKATFRFQLSKNKCYNLCSFSPCHSGPVRQPGAQRSVV